MSSVNSWVLQAGAVKMGKTRDIDLQSPDQRGDFVA